MTIGRLITIRYIVVFTLFLMHALFQTSPGLLETLFVLAWYWAPDAVMWLHTNGVFYAIASFFYRKQIKEFLIWLDKNADFRKSEIDFATAPKLPKPLRAYLIRMGTALQLKRALEFKKQKLEKSGKKSTAKRGTRKKSSGSTG